MTDNARPCRAAVVEVLSEALGDLFQHDQTTYWTEPAAESVLDHLQAAGYTVCRIDALDPQKIELGGFSA